MDIQSANAKIVTKLMFRLLPVQVVLAAVTVVSGLVSSYFASNYIGVEAMSAVGLYSPVNMLLTAISLMLSSGATAVSGNIWDAISMTGCRMSFRSALFYASSSDACLRCCFCCLAFLI